LTSSAGAQQTARTQQRQQQQTDRAQQMNANQVQVAVEQMAAQSDPLQLIYRKDVQRDLKLELGQRNKLDNFHDRQLADLRQARIQNRRNNAPLIEMEEKQRKDTQDKIDELLTDAQKARLKQIALQLQGESAVLMAAVQKELAVTPDQVQQFASLQAARDAKISALQNSDQMPRRGQNMADQVKQIQKELNEGIAAVLTEEQAQKLKKLFGDPFKAG
jgi:hypothetical protein